MQNYEVRPIKYDECKQWIIKKHYAKRMPSVSFGFGLYKDLVLKGVCTFGVPASPYLCAGVCGKKYKDSVFELNRLCLDDNKKNEASFFVSRCIKMMARFFGGGPLVLVSYADSGVGHIGYVYQATNWLYTGKTKERTDIFSGDNKHGRHHKGDKTKRQLRTSKHRYVKFCGTKAQKKELLRELRYDVSQYPKGETHAHESESEMVTQLLLF